MKALKKDKYASSELLGILIKRLPGITDGASLILGYLPSPYYAALAGLYYLVQGE